MISQRLRDLDNRVLQLDRRQAALRTEEGWRKQARNWRWMAAAAFLMLAVAVVGGEFAGGEFAGLIGIGGVLAFQAGTLKAEDDRLNQRGRLERLRPPGL